MEFLDERIQHYVETHTEPESPLLARLNRETHAKVLMPRMLSGHLQGRVLAMLSHMVKPSNILEIGTFTGYSALCLAEGLAEGGHLHTLDINEELEDWVNGFIKEAGLEHKITLHIGAAAKIIPHFDLEFDMVFIDADKENYPLYYNLVFDKVKRGGFILIDNVLWSGKVVESDKKVDKDTRAILEFNKMVHLDERVENVLFPIRDGIMILRKK